jgi:CarD family transcriptional regulator
VNPTAAPAAVLRKEAQIPQLATEEAIEIGPELGPVECTFEIGDNVVYPHHGAGVVLRKETKDLLGEKRDYLTIKILHNNMTVMVPCENAHRAGLRRVIDGEEVDKVIDVLTGELSEMPKNWNRRFKQDRKRLRAGRGGPEPGDPRVGEGSLHWREADVHAGKEDPRVGVHVRARQG